MRHILPFKAFPWLVLVFVSTFHISCINEEVCEDVATLPVRIGFFVPDTVAEPLPVFLDSITVFGLGSDSILYNNQYNAGQIELPLNSTVDSCAFVLFLPGDNIPTSSDTVWFFYDRQPILISMDCGFVTFYELKNISYTQNRIDSLSIEDKNISNTLDEHIKIFPVVIDDDN